MTDVRDEALQARFDALKEEDRATVPDFGSLLDRARRAGAGEESDPVRSVRPWWRALSAGAVLAAAGIGAIALMGNPSQAELDFRDAVAWATSDSLFASVGGPSDGLLETPGWTLLKTGNPLGGGTSGLSDLLNFDSGFNDERNKS